MTLLRQIVHGLSSWIDAVAETIIALQRWFGSSRLVRFVERADCSFDIQGGGRAVSRGMPSLSMTIRDGRIVDQVKSRMAAALKGCQVEFVLKPDRFMFRTLELPRRASDFLDGVVRAQIDRLTPWSAADAAFGWSAPTEIASDRVQVTVAATARALIAPLVEAVVGVGVEWVSATTLPPQTAETVPEPICVYERNTQGTLEFHKLRRILVALLAVMGLLACGAAAVAMVYGDKLESRRYDVAARVAQRRAALEMGRTSGDESGVAILEKRKREVPSSVIVLEALSQILPDDTYLTELRILGDKLQIVGLARDPPSLIRLIEQSSHFSQATFFAPTTRAPSETKEHFSIEARLEPVYTPGP